MNSELISENKFPDIRIRNELLSLYFFYSVHETAPAGV